MLDQSPFESKLCKCQWQLVHQNDLNSPGSVLVTVDPGIVLVTVDAGCTLVYVTTAVVP